MRFCTTALLLTISTVTAQAEERIAAKVVTEVKAATVFLKVEAGTVAGSGSGFVIRTEGEAAWIVTNEHVVNPPIRVTGPVRCKAVFNSGRRDEKVLDADLLAADPLYDLAVLKVTGLKSAPKPLDPTRKAELVETLPVYTFGFPFGESLSTTNGNPTHTVGSSSVTSLREGKDGELELVQLGGGVNPGNSGGPVVDAQGRLVGVAVAKVRGSEISFAVPASRVGKLTEGRLAGLSVTSTKAGDGLAELKIEVRFVDPFEKIRSAAARVVLADAVKGKLNPGPKGVWPELPGADLIDLKVEKQKGVGSLKIKVPDGKPVTYLVQPVYTNVAKVTAYAEPAPHRVDLSRPVATIPKQLPDPRVTRPSDPVKGQDTEVAGLKVRSLIIDSSSGHVSRTATPACLCWTEDGKGFYFLNSAGTLRRIRLSDLSEEAKLETGKKCTWLTRSGEGLVLTVTELQEAWVLDPKTLGAKKKVPIASAQRVVSAPGLTVAFAVAEREVTVLDLQREKVVRQYASNELGTRVIWLRYPVVSPDGKYLFAESGIEQLTRFKIQGDTLSHDAATERIAQGFKIGICISDDSSLVCFPTGGGNYALKGEERSPYSTLVYKVEDLGKPAFVLRSGHYPQAVGFDTKARLIYGQNYDNQLLVFDDRGIKLKEYLLDSSERGSVCQLLPHPDGRKVLMLASKKIFFVELPPK